MKITAIKTLLTMCSPILKELVCDKIMELQDEASETSNPVDDILTDFLYYMICGDK